MATTALIREEKRPQKKRASVKAAWSQIPDKRPVVAMLAMGLLLMLANMSIEPIITIYVGQLMADQSRVTLVSGVVMSAGALGSIVSASRLGKLADRVGHWNVIVGALVVSALLLIPQAFVSAGWELVGLRFLMGLALGGLLPCVASILRHSVPVGIAGSVLGYSTSSQFVGQVVGPLLGGFVGGHIGMRAVFLGTSMLMGLGGLYAFIAKGASGGASPHAST
jgi:MFS family permease